MAIPMDNVGIVLQMKAKNLEVLTREEREDIEEALETQTLKDDYREQLEKSLSISEFNSKYPKKFTRVNLKEEANGIKFADCVESVEDIVSQLQM